MARFFGIVSLLAAVLGWISVSRAEQPLVEGPIEPVDIGVQILAGSTGPVYWSHEFEKPTSGFLRLHFTGIEDKAGDEFTIVLRDRNGSPVHTYVKDEFSAHPQLWSPLIEGDYVRIEVQGDHAPAGLTFTIKDITFHRSGFVKYSLAHDPPELEKILAYEKLPNIYNPSHAVAKLVFSIDGSQQACSGFLVTDDELLTNQHCIDRKETCIGNAFAIFGYEETDTGLNKGVQFACIELIDSDPKLDFALIRLAGHPGSTYGHLELTRRVPTDHEQTYLIQHPEGKPKQIARKQCFISTLSADAIEPKTDFGHQCDTISGSSGSPLLGKDYKVIGLHHLGFDDSGRWKAENRAVQITKVMDRLKMP